MTIVPVREEIHRDNARMLISEYLHWIGESARREYGLSSDARQIGYRKLRLESLKFLSRAHALYKSVGFVEIDPYAGNSMEKYRAPEAADAYRSSVVFMEMVL